MPEKTFDWKMYRYTPTLVGAIVSLALFSILAVLHVWQWLRTQRFILVWLVVGAFCEVGGYGARISSHFDSKSNSDIPGGPPDYDSKAWAGFITQGTLLLIGPLFFAATIYMILGRTIRLAGGEGVSVIKPKWCTRIFVASDVSTLIIQALGSGIMGTLQLKIALAGEKIVIAGLALQVTTFVAFLFIAIDFHVRMNSILANVPQTAALATGWRRTLWILYTVSSLILFRCIFRLIEYATGNASYLISHEWTLYVFDTVPMFLMLVLMLVLQPARYISENDGKQIASDEEMVLEQTAGK